jgi:HlyD family secretion protein
VAAASGQLDRARLDLQHSIIRAPVDGTVIARNIDVGQAVASSLTAPTLFTIAQDLRHMQVHAAVDEADIGQVRSGQSAAFTVDAFRGDTFQAVVKEVRNSPQTAQNVVTYDVVLDVANPDEKLRPGMTANVLILIVQKTQVTAVSNEALRFRPDGAKVAAASGKNAGGLLPGTVYVPQGAKAVLVPVHTGITDGNLTEVDGIEPGRAVIIDRVGGAKKKASTGGPGRGL